MKRIKLIFIVLATITLLFLAYKSSVNVVTHTEANKNSNEKLLPDLAKNIDNIGTVIVTTKGKNFQIHLEDGKWLITNKFSYPIGIEKIRDLVQNSADIRILEKKTSSPENLKNIGLAEIDKEDAKGARVILQGADSKDTYADYIRGVNRRGVSAAKNDEVYARLENSNQAYLVRANLNFDLTPHALLSGETFAIPYKNLQSIEFNYPKHTADNFTISKALPTDLDFGIINPANNEIKSYGKINSISTSLEYMDLDDVLPIETFPIKEPETIIIYKTFNGLTMVVKLFKNNDESWLSFSASADENNQKSSEEAARVNSLALKWVYKLDFKSTGGFYYKLADLIKE